MYYFADAQFAKPEVMMFISRAHVSCLLSSSNAVNTRSWNYHRILAY